MINVEAHATHCPYGKHIIVIISMALGSPDDSHASTTPNAMPNDPGYFAIGAQRDGTQNTVLSLVASF